MRCLALLTLLLLLACSEKKPTTTVVSEKPPSAETNDKSQLQAQASRINIRTRIRLSDVQSIIEAELPPTIEGTGEQQQCERVLGIKLCGTAQWRFQVKRGVISTQAADNDRLALDVPLQFSGTAGVQGDIAKTLRLSELDFDGALLGKVLVSLDLDEQWCPIIETDVSYQWLEKPSVEWIAGLDMDLSSPLDKAIKKQLASLDTKIQNAIDCEEFKANIAQHWRHYTFPVSVYQDTSMHLNLQPVSFAFSGMKTSDSYAGVSFTLTANTLLESTPIDDAALALPPLARTDYAPGQSAFEFLIRSDYEQLTNIAKPLLIDKTFSSDSPAGAVNITINDIALSGNNEGVTVKLLFDANLPASRTPSKGELYLTATPQVDLLSQEISLTNIKISKVLDSTMWNAIATLFESQIISALEEQSLWDVHEQIEELEQTLLAQINDPDQTSGLEVSASHVDIALKELLPEPQALAALLSVNTDLDIVIPDTLLKNN